MRGKTYYSGRSAPRFSGRGRRSPAPAIIVAVVLLIFGCWLFNLTCGRGKKEDTSSLGEYANRARAVVEASNGIGQAWNETWSGLPDLIANTESLGQRLGELESQALDLLSQAKSLVPPRSLESAHDALLICLEQRYRALKNLRPDLLNALSALETEVYAQSISEDLREMAYSDGNYQFFRRVAEEVLQANKLQDVSFPESVWLPDWESATKKRALAFLEALRATEVHGMALLKVTFDPASSLLEENGEVVHRLPSVDEVSVAVTVENQGNRPEKEVKVTLSLYSTINTSPTRQEKTIESIGPGERVEVVFQGLRPTTGGVRNILEVRVEPVPKESFIDNNDKLIYFTLG